MPKLPAPVTLAESALQETPKTPKCPVYDQIRSTCFTKSNSNYFHQVNLKYEQLNPYQRNPGINENINDRKY